MNPNKILSFVLTSILVITSPGLASYQACAVAFHDPIKGPEVGEVRLNPITNVPSSFIKGQDNAAPSGGLNEPIEKLPHSEIIQEEKIDLNAAELKNVPDASLKEMPADTELNEISEETAKALDHQDVASANAHLEKTYDKNAGGNRRNAQEPGVYPFETMKLIGGGNGKDDSTLGRNTNSGGNRLRRSAQAAQAPAGGASWNDQVKQFVKDEIDQGELGNDLAEVTRSKLPPAAQKALDNFKKQRGGATIYKVDAIGNQTAFLFVGADDDVMVVELIDAKGQTIAKGSQLPEDDFSWDENKIKLIGGGNGQDDSTLGRNLNSGGKETKGIPSNRRIKDAFAAKFYDKKKGTFTLDREPKIPAAKLPQDSAAARFIEKIQQEPLQAYGIIAHKISVNGTAVYAVEWQSDEDGDSIYGISLFSKTGEPIASVKERGLGPIWKVYPDPKTERAGNLARNDQSSKDESGPEPTYADPKTFPAPFNNLKFLAALQKLVEARVKAVPANYQMNPPVANVDSFANANVTPRRILEVGWTVYDINGELWLKVTHVIPNDQPHWYDLGPKLIAGGSDSSFGRRYPILSREAVEVLRELLEQSMDGYKLMSRTGLSETQLENALREMRRLSVVNVAGEIDRSRVGKTYLSVLPSKRGYAQMLISISVDNDLGPKLIGGGNGKDDSTLGRNLNSNGKNAGKIDTTEFARVPVAIQLSVDPAEPFPLKVQLQGTLSILKKGYGLQTKGAPRKIKNKDYSYSISGTIPQNMIQKALDQQIGGVDGISILQPAVQSTVADIAAAPEIGQAYTIKTAAAGGATWNDQVKQFVKDEIDQGELGNDLAEVTRSKLPPAAQKAFDSFKKQWGGATIYKVDAIGNQTAFLFVGADDDVMIVELIDAKGQTIAKGSQLPEDDFSWDENKIKLIGGGNGQDDSTLGRNLNSGGKETKGVPSNRRIKDAFAAKFYDKKKGTFTLDRQPKIPAAKLPQDSAAARFIEKIQQEPLQAYGIIAHKISVNGTAVYAVEWQSDEDGDSIYGISLFSKTGEPIASVKERGLGPIWKVYPDQKTERAGNLARNDQSSKDESGPEPTYADPKTFPAPFNNLKFLAALQRLVEARVKTVPANYQMNPPVPNPNSFANAAVTPRRILEVGWTVYDINGELWLKVTHVMPNDQPHWYDLGPRSIGGEKASAVKTIIDKDHAPPIYRPDQRRRLRRQRKDES